MIHDSQMDKMLDDIVDIFNNVEGVQLVRLGGLVRRASRISNQMISMETIDYILHKMKMQKVINWNYAYQCPYCKEVFYQVDDTPKDKIKLCDTCQTMFIPEQHLYQANIAF